MCGLVVVYAVVSVSGSELVSVLSPRRIVFVGLCTYLTVNMLRPNKSKRSLGYLRPLDTNNLMNDLDRFNYVLEKVVPRCCYMSKLLHVEPVTVPCLALLLGVWL